MKAMGERFDNVHEWLDAYFKVHGPMHRVFRHHAEGVATVRRMWGKRAAEAAKLHILRDNPSWLKMVPTPGMYKVGRLKAELDLAQQEWERTGRRPGVRRKTL